MPNTTESVVHPSHYIKSAVMVEPGEISCNFLTEFGAAFEYIARAEYKGQYFDDLNKAAKKLEKYLSRGFDGSNLLGLDKLWLFCRLTDNPILRELDKATQEKDKDITYKVTSIRTDVNEVAKEFLRIIKNYIEDEIGPKQ